MIQFDARISIQSLKAIGRFYHALINNPSLGIIILENHGNILNLSLMLKYLKKIYGLFDYRDAKLSTLYLSVSRNNRTELEINGTILTINNQILHCIRILWTDWPSL